MTTKNWYKIKHYLPNKDQNSPCSDADKVQEMRNVGTLWTAQEDRLAIVLVRVIITAVSWIFTVICFTLTLQRQVWHKQQEKYTTRSAWGCSTHPELYSSMQNCYRKVTYIQGSR